MNKLEAYTLILKTINDCAAKVELDNDFSRYGLPTLIKKTELEAQFGIAIKQVCGQSWFECGYYATIGLFGSAHNRTISWSDDGMQPNDEWLYRLSFPTGAYIFGEGYLVETFDAFFSELKLFAPKYSDSNNHNLYFTSKTSAHVHAVFPELLKKYQGLVQNEINAQRIAKLKDELAALGATCV